MNAAPYQAVLTDDLLARLEKSAEEADRAAPGTISESMGHLHDSGILTASLRSADGQLADLGTLAGLVRRVSAADASAGLVLAMHFIHTRGLDLSDAQSAASEYAALLRAGRASFLGGLISEQVSGSPRRGNRPQTQLVRTDSGWLLRGRKRYVTGSYALSHALITAEDPNGELATALVDLKAPGVRIEAAWDVLGLRGTASNDLILDGVLVRAEAVGEHRRGSAHDDGSWSALLSAIYAGIGDRGRQLVSERGTGSVDNGSKPAPLAPWQTHFAGELDLAWLSMDALYHRMLQLNAAEPRSTSDGSHKLLIHRAATGVIDAAGKVLGTASVWQSNLWQRLYRDLRVGWHNSPGEYEVTQALGEALSGS